MYLLARRVGEYEAKEVNVLLSSVFVPYLGTKSELKNECLRQDKIFS